MSARPIRPILVYLPDREIEAAIVEAKKEGRSLDADRYEAELKRRRAARATINPWGS